MRSRDGFTLIELFVVTVPSRNSIRTGKLFPGITCCRHVQMLEARGPMGTWFNKLGFGAHLLK